MAQVKINAVDLRFNGGVSFSRKPEAMFGTPITPLAEVSVISSTRWRFVAEGGFTGFRDTKFPNQSISLFGGRSTYQLSYAGLRIGLNLLDSTRTGQLVLSAGANNFSVSEPHVTYQAGLILSGYIVRYESSRYLNIPIQIDYVFASFSKRRLSFSASGRWNLNAYHAFPDDYCRPGLPDLCASEKNAPRTDCLLTRLIPNLPDAPASWPLRVPGVPVRIYRAW